MDTKKTSNNNIYSDILVIVLGFTILYLLFYYKVFVIIALTLGILSIFSLRIATIVSHFWRKLAFYLGWVNSRIILTIFYYLFLFPLSILYRIFRKKKKQNLESVFENRNHKYEAVDLENTW